MLQIFPSFIILDDAAKRFAAYGFFLFSFRSMNKDMTMVTMPRPSVLSVKMSPADSY